MTHPDWPVTHHGRSTRQDYIGEGEPRVPEKCKSEAPQEAELVAELDTLIEDLRTPIVVEYEEKPTHVLRRANISRIKAANAIAAIRAQPAPQVKALEWTQDRNIWVAETIIGTYSVGFEDGWWATLEGPNLWDWDPSEDPRFYSGPHSGQLAAQADYERRILSALSGEAQR